MSPMPPPSGDSKKAEKYLEQVIRLIESDKLTLHHTDLSKFNMTQMADHYFVNLGDHQIEISHSKQPETGEDSYVMIFTNIKFIGEGNSNEKVVLAYLHLEVNQFIKFKSAADDQIERVRKIEEEKKLIQALDPIDSALGEMLGDQKNDENVSLEDDIKSSSEYKTLSDYSQLNSH